MTDLRKETLEAILRQGGRNTHTNEARDMAAECLRRRAGGVSTQEAAERVIADLRAKGLAAWADDLADHYGLPKTAKPQVGYYPYMVPFQVSAGQTVAIPSGPLKGWTVTNEGPGTFVSEVPDEARKVEDERRDYFEQMSKERERLEYEDPDRVKREGKL